MRVLHIYSGNLYGGIETMLVTLARQRDLCPQMSPHFALCFEGRLSEELTAAGVPVQMLGNVRASRLSTVLRARRALADYLRDTGFDVVICHAPWSQAIFGPVVRGAGLPLVFWLHDATDGRHWSERWARRTPPDLSICNSRFTASKLNNLYTRARAEVIYCPVEFSPAAYTQDERRATRAELNTPEDATVIVQVSRMERLKGHGLHLEALGTLGDLSDWVCWLVGGAQRPHEIRYLNELKSMAGHTGIAERVRFVGQRSDVKRLLAAADIYCQPNIGPEGFGLTFVEALDSGLPIVTTALGGACEVVDASCGFLLPSGDTQALANALRRLINDRTLRNELGSAGPKWARQLCDPATQSQDLYQTLTALV